MSEADNERSYPERALITVEAREELARDIRRWAGRHNDPDDSVYEVVAKMARKIEELEAWQTRVVELMSEDSVNLSPHKVWFKRLDALMREAKGTKGGDGNV